MSGHGVRRARPREFEDREVERDNAIGGDIGCSKGFCHECEAFVDEAVGKLHRATCKAVAPERRKSA